MAEKYAPLCRTETGILDLLDEILNKIILLLTPRERVPLGNSCQRLKALVFGDQELLRYLDFSKKAGLTTMTHIRQYFDNESGCQYIRRINARNVNCMKAGEQLNNSIGRAINLVDVNIHGTQFEDIEQLGSFLEPLLHLEKLSIDWPLTTGVDVSLCRSILQRPFSKLTYLSVRFKTVITTMFTSSLTLCQHLEELCMHALWECDPGTCITCWNSDMMQLTKLKIVQYHGWQAVSIKEELATVLPDPKRWTDFQLCGATKDDPQGFYIEKDVEVCEELLRSRRLPDILNTAPWENFNLGWALNPEFLLKEVLRITHEDVPKNWCCLSRFVGGLRHLLKVEEARRLLKDPRYQISQLYLNHKIEGRCDAHLLASCFPNLSKLVLHAVAINLEKSPKDSRFQRRLSRRCSSVPEKQQDDSPNLDSSFKMLVENTPNLRHFKLYPVYWTEVEDWDWGALCLISGWQNLETLDFPGIPGEDGQFLIDIGKRCKNLQKLYLRNWSFSEANFDKAALLQMLGYCRNLRELTIRCYNIDQAEMFTSLAKNVKLERVHAINLELEHSAAPWISSLETMIRQCDKLTTIICNTRFKTVDDFNKAVSAVRRIKGECCRPDFQIQVTCQTRDARTGSMVIGTASEDFRPNEPFCMYD